MSCGFRSERETNRLNAVSLVIVVHGIHLSVGVRVISLEKDDHLVPDWLYDYVHSVKRCKIHT